ncbi:MAG: hypothetical protein HYV17_03840 [Xanthomonadales bacterium]|nr:hypothetical protein [Xanthomonadales bacterium]
MSVHRLAILLFAALPAIADAATYTVTNTNDSGSGSLRWAITQANATADSDTIAFNIPGGGAPIIGPTSALPTFTHPVTIDGATQPGYAGTPLIQIDGVNAGTSSDGLHLATSGSTIRALSIMRFYGHGIRIDSFSSNNTVTACYVGLNSAGAAAANGGTGVFISDGTTNVIGPGNVISGNVVDGVRIDLASSNSNVVAGNRIGTNPAGTAAIPNGYNGVVITASINNRIGGTTSADLNVISGNTRSGIGIGAGASGNLIQRNYIGLAADGATALGNGWNGVYVINSPANRIGGDVAGTWNIISANGWSGIELVGGAADGNIIQRNIIGSDLFGTLDRGNALHGVNARSGNNRIGTGQVGAGGNLISGNSGYGIFIGEGGATDNVIDGNRIGTDLAGAAALPNSAGIRVGDGGHRTAIGTAGVGNTISGNSGHGIEIDSSSDIESITIRGNRIGTNAAGTAAVANGGRGIFAIGFNALSIGGTDAGAGNLVSGNGGDGILISAWNTNVASPVVRNIVGLTTSGASLGNAGAGILVTGNGGGVRLQENRIGGNGGLGIDLGSTGVLANDVGDGDSGVNGLQNYPIIGSAFESEGTTTLTGTLNSTPTTAFSIEFFASSTCDASGHGEGASFVGNVNVTTNSSGDAGFSLPVSGYPVGTVFSATASRAVGASSTSEFSPCMTSQTYPATIQFAADTSTTPETAGTATITLTRSGNTTNTASVRVDGTDWSTTVGADYQAFAPLTVTFAPGQTSRTISLTLIDDTMHDPGEILALDLSNPSPNVELGVRTRHLLTITDNDPVPTLSMDGGGCSVNEGHTGNRPCNIVFRLSNPTHLGVGFQVSAWGDTAYSGIDFMEQNSLNVSMAEGATTVTVPIEVIGDTLDEANETFTIRVTNIYNASPGEMTGTGTIVDDDAAPTVSVADRSCVEGNIGFSYCSFTISLSAASSQSVRGTLAATEGSPATAMAGVDFDPVAAASWIVPAGDTSTTLDVVVLSDTLDEANETFLVNLAGLTNAAASGNDTQATATITDDDNPPTVSIADKSCVEVNVGSGTCSFTISLGAVSGRAVSGTYATATGGATPATAGVDYTAVGATPWSIAAGSTSATVAVSTLGDTLDEPNETFLVNLAGLTNAAASGNDTQATATITDNDNPPTLSIDAGGCSVIEGDGGSVNCAFVLRLSAASGRTVTFNTATANGTATAGSDYTAHATTARSIAVGSSTLTVNVPVLGDSVEERDETFALSVTGVVNASPASLSGTATILDDDLAELIHFDGFE